MPAVKGGENTTVRESDLRLQYCSPYDLVMGLMRMCQARSPRVVAFRGPPTFPTEIWLEAESG